MFRLSSTTRGRCLLRASVLVLVCALGGACNLVTSSLSVLAARNASFPEEEEHSAKDRSALVAAVQPSRKGTIRPHHVAAERPARPHDHTDVRTSTANSLVHRSLTGAGIYQLC